MEGCVRIALFSDVHANCAALRAVLEAIDRESPDAVFALGDLVGRGPDPEAVVREIERREIPTLRGNWDDWVAGGPGWDARPKRRAHVEAARKLMRKKSIARLAEHPETRALVFEGTSLLLAHGSPRDPLELLIPEMSDERLHLAIAAVDADVVAVGHSHRAFVRKVRSVLLINCGTVGYPFDHDPRPSFAVLDVGLGQAPVARIVRVPYRIGRTLTSLERRVSDGVIDERIAGGYRVALLGEPDERMAPLAGSDAGPEAAVKLVAPRVRSLYKRWSDARSPWSQIDFFEAKWRAAIDLRAALEIARPLVERGQFERAIEKLRHLARTIQKAREPYAIESELVRFGVLSASDNETRLELMRVYEHLNQQRKSALSGAYPRERMIEEGLSVLALTMRPRKSGTLEEAARRTIARLAKRLSRPLDITTAEADRMRRIGRIAAILEDPFPTAGLGGIEMLANALAEAIDIVASADVLAEFASSPLTERRMKGRDLASVRARANVLTETRSRERMAEIETKSVELAARFRRAKERWRSGR
jgi:putative phosphoesterase